MHQQLIVDIGNTSSKVVLYQDERIQQTLRFENDDEFLSFVSNYKKVSSIVSSVRTQSFTKKVISILSAPLLLDYNTKIPIENHYATPKTLGNDRLANVIAASTLKKGNSLVIDVGTCLKIDFITDKKQYIGGLISPGFNMRYQALHNFTANLPLYQNETTKHLSGNSTKSSMITGVYQGILQEIKGFVNSYEKEYNQLNIFLTGGDLSYFKNEEISQKNSIFADENLTLKGLKIILDYNE